MSQKLTTKQQYWSEILESAANSGLSLVEFAKANQLDPQSLYRWRNQLKKHTAVKKESVTQLSEVITTSYAATPSLLINVRNAQLQFNALLSLEWLERLLAQQGPAA